MAYPPAPYGAQPVPVAKAPEPVVQLGTWYPDAGAYLQLDRWFEEVDQDKSGSVGGGAVVKFLSRSNLPKETLREIWTIVDTHRSGKLSKLQFITTVRFVSVLCSPIYMGSKPSVELFNSTLKSDIAFPSQLNPPPPEPPKPVPVKEPERPEGPVHPHVHAHPAGPHPGLAQHAPQAQVPTGYGYAPQAYAYPPQAYGQPAVAAAHHAAPVPHYPPQVHPQHVPQYPQQSVQQPVAQSGYDPRAYGGYYPAVAAPVPVPVPAPVVLAPSVQPAHPHVEEEEEEEFSDFAAAAPAPALLPTPMAPIAVPAVAPSSMVMAPASVSTAMHHIDLLDMSSAGPEDEDEFGPMVHSPMPSQLDLTIVAEALSAAPPVAAVAQDDDFEAEFITAPSAVSTSVVPSEPSSLSAVTTAPTATLAAAVSSTSLSSLPSISSMTNMSPMGSTRVVSQEDKLSVFDALVESDLQVLNEDWDDFAEAAEEVVVEPVVAETAAVVEVISTQPAVDLMDLLSEPVVEVPPAAAAAAAAAEDDWGDADDFGDFAAHPASAAVEPIVAPIVAPSVSLPAAEEDFGDFGDFESHPESATSDTPITATAAEPEDLFATGGHHHGEDLFAYAPAADFSPVSPVPVPVRAPAPAPIVVNTFVEDNLLEFSPVDHHPTIPAVRSNSVYGGGVDLLDLLSEPAPEVPAPPASSPKPLMKLAPPSSSGRTISPKAIVPASAPSIAVVPVPAVVAAPKPLPAGPAKPLGISELESLSASLAKKRLYDEAYHCAKQISVLKKLQVLTQQKAEAMEADDLETALKLKKAAAAVAKDLQPSDQEAVWVAAMNSNRSGQSIQDMEESIALFDEALAKKFHKLFVNTTPAAQAALEDRMKHLILAKRTARMALAVCSSHTQHPRIWLRLIKVLHGKLSECLTVHKAFVKLSPADQTAAMQRKEMSVYLAAMQQIAECALWVSASSTEAMVNETDSDAVWKLAKEIMHHMASTWDTRSNVRAFCCIHSSSHLIHQMENLSREDLAIQVEQASERQGAVTEYCNFTLRPVISTVTSTKEEVVYFEHRARMGSLLFMQPLVNIWLKDVDKAMPTIESAFC